MAANIFTSDKAPFVLSLTLSVLGWLVTAIVGILSDVVILGVQTTRKADDLTFTITNHSVKKPLVAGAINFICIEGNCLKPTDSDGYVEMHHIAPYSIQGNKTCYPSAKNFGAVLSLPPKATIQFKARAQGTEVPRFQFNGILSENERGCPGTNATLKVDNIWVVEGCSLILLIVDYYYHFLLASIALTFFFLIVILWPHLRR
jgi:hypothetical protein